MRESLVKIVEFLKSIKCKNISAFDLSENGEEKYFIIASALNTDDTKKAADEVAEFIGYDKDKDGYYKGEWIILNAEPIIIHIFTTAERAKYNLDRLYKSKEIHVLKPSKSKKSK